MVWCTPVWNLHLISSVHAIAAHWKTVFKNSLMTLNQFVQCFAHYVLPRLFFNATILLYPIEGYLSKCNVKVKIWQKTLPRQKGPPKEWTYKPAGVGKEEYLPWEQWHSITCWRGLQNISHNIGGFSEILWNWQRGRSPVLGHYLYSRVIEKNSTFSTLRI